MKNTLFGLLFIILICLTGCQQVAPPAQNDNPTTPESIPVLFCNFEDKTISIGEWDISTNEITIAKDSLVGISKDPYTLYSLHWDGNKTISGLQVYLEELNSFSSMTLCPSSYGEFVKEGVTITTLDDGRLALNSKDKSGNISESDITIDGTGKVPSTMMSGAAISVVGDTVFYLRSVMTAAGIYLICSDIHVQSMTAESYVINSKPYSYEEIDIGSFGADAFAEENGVIYFYTQSAVYSFAPMTRECSLLLELNDLNLPIDNPDVRFQISNVTAYEENIIVECAEYVTDIPTSKTSFLCSPDGNILKSLIWNCTEELVIFPKG